MKGPLTRTLVLGYLDIKKEFILDTNTIVKVIAAVLSQKDNSGRKRVIAYGSRVLNAHEKENCVTRKELLVIYYICNHFKHYLYGKQLLLRTDHNRLHLC